MKCPHCLDSFYGQPRDLQVAEDKDGRWLVEINECPACERSILTLGVNPYFRTAPKVNFGLL